MTTLKIHSTTMTEVNSLCIVCSKKFNVCLASNDNINSVRVYNNFDVFCQHLCSDFYRHHDEKGSAVKLLLDYYYDTFSFCKSCETLVDNLVQLQKNVDTIVKSLATKIKTTGPRRQRYKHQFSGQKIQVEEIVTARITKIEKDISKYYSPQVTLTDCKLDVSDEEQVEDTCNVDPLSLPYDDCSESQFCSTETFENLDIPSSSFRVNSSTFQDDEQNGDSGVVESINNVEDGEMKEDDSAFNCEIKEESEEFEDDDGDEYKPEFHDLMNESKSFQTRSSSSSISSTNNNNNNNVRRKQKFDTISTTDAPITIKTKRGRKRKILTSKPKKLTKVSVAKNLPDETEADDDQPDDDDIDSEMDYDANDEDWNDQDEIKTQFTNSKSKFKTVTIGPGVYRYGEWEFRDVGNNVLKCHCGLEVKGGRCNMYRHLRNLHFLQTSSGQPKITEDDQGIFHYEGFTFEKTGDVYRCGTCGHLNKNRHAMTRHLNTVHNTNKPRCWDCGLPFMTEGRLKNHKCQGIKYNRKLKFVHLEGDNYLYDGKWKYQKMTTTLADGSVGVVYKCGTCDVERKGLHLLSSHIRHRHAETKKYVCEVCGYFAPTKGSFDTHQAIHSTKRDFICDVCGLEFKSRARLRGHKVGHRSERFKCTKCERTFQYPYGLTRHCLAAGHQQDKVPQLGTDDKCVQCDRLFSCKKALDKHLPKCKGVKGCPVNIQKKLEVIVQKHVNKANDIDQDGQGGGHGAISNDGPQEKIDKS